MRVLARWQDVGTRMGLLVLLGLTVSWAMAQEPKESGAPVRGSIVEDRAARKLLEAGDARVDAEEYNKAVEVWQSVIERYPRSKVRFEAQMRLGNYLLERERAYDRARTYFEAAATEDNSDEAQRAEALLKMGVCFYEARNFGKCFSTMRELIEKFPVSPQVNSAWYYIGLGHFQLGHYSRAISALEKVGTALSTEAGQQEKVEAGKRLFVKVEDADLAVLELGQSIKGECTAASGDVEPITLFPVGRNVRLVLGSIVTALGKPRPGNGVLEVRGGDRVVVTYTDSHTADKQFDRKVLKEVVVVGNALVEVTDGAFSESLRGVILGRPINVQITDADLDISDDSDRLTAVIEVFREKTQEELEAEQAKAAAEAQGGAGAPANPQTPVDPTQDAKKLTADEEFALRYRAIDKLTVSLAEARIERQAPPAAEEPSPESDETESGAAAAGDEAAGAKSADQSSPPKPGEKNAVRAGGTSKTAATKTPASKAPAVKTPGKPATKKIGGGKPAAKPAEKPSTKPAAEGGEPPSGDTPAPKPAEAAESKPEQPAEPPDTTIHSGVFRAQVDLVLAETAVDGDDILQALPSDMVQITFADEVNLGNEPREVKLRVRTIEGNLGEVRVTRSVISDQELRIRTQLKTAGALTNIAQRYKEFGLKKNADAKYQQALAVCEDINEEAQKLGGRLLEELYVQLWQIYYQMENLDLAAAMCQRLQREFPNSGFVDDALLQLADVTRKQGELDRAIGIYSRLLAITTSQLRGNAQFGIADCYKEMAKKQTGPAADQLRDRAFQEYKKVFDNFPDSGRVGEAVAEMANYYFQQKDYARAIDVFESVLADHPDAKFLDVILFNYGRCLYRLDRKGDARRQFDQLIAEFPESPLAADSKRISEELSKRGF